MKFKFFQIEIVRGCNASCIMCPARNLNNVEKMSLSMFHEISKFFTNTKWIHLQGWGEPLLHENFFDMVDLSKKYCNVSFTTNGILLNKDICEKIIDHDIDLVAISFAGIELHNKLRLGTNLNKLLENARTLIMLKNKSGNDKPEIVATYMLTKENIEEVPKFVELIAKIGFDTVIFTNLDYVFNEKTNELKAFSCRDTNKKFEKILNKAETIVKKYGLKFKRCSLKMEDVLICEASPIDSVVISVNGRIYPCAYINVPSKNITRIFCDKLYVYKKPFFGYAKNLIEHWNSYHYKKFREAFERRIEYYRRRFLEIVSNPFELESLINELREKYPLPEICRTCYKAYGI